MRLPLRGPWTRVRIARNCKSSLWMTARARRLRARLYSTHHRNQYVWNLVSRLCLLPVSHISVVITPPNAPLTCAHFLSAHCISALRPLPLCPVLSALCPLPLCPVLTASLPCAHCQLSLIIAHAKLIERIFTLTNK
jgi:hypothetical protein